MAKNKEPNTRALTGPRQLRLDVPAYTGVWDVPSLSYTPFGGWVGSATSTSIYYVSKINVNLGLDDLTMFPQAIALQDPGYYLRSQADGANDLIVVDIVAIKELDPEVVIANIKLNNSPGFPGTTDDFTQIISGNYRMMVQDLNNASNPTLQQTISSKDFSSGSPFAQDFLWLYRFVIPRQDTHPSLAPLDILEVPASRFIIGAVIGQEKDLPYMMRLKNSYELQQ